VLNTPSHHRVHHGRNAYCIDRNFGGVLIIWDKVRDEMCANVPGAKVKMFHTFEPERLDDPPIYGLIHNERTFNQLWLQVRKIDSSCLMHVTVLVELQANISLRRFSFIR